MNDQRTQWSTYRIVGTHVAISGIAAPWLGNLCGIAIALQFGLTPSPSYITELAAQAAGFIAGTWLSIAYLRAVAYHPDPKQCLTPALAFLAALTVIAVVVSLLALWHHQPVHVRLTYYRLMFFTPIVYLIIFAGVALLTTLGFRRLGP